MAWHKDIQEAARVSAWQHKSMLVMVGARWCGPCHKMLQQTFPDPAVAARVNQQFVPVLIDADEQAALVQTLNVDSTPTVMVISPDRKVVGRIVGFQSAAQLDARLAAIQPVATRPLIRKALVGPAPVIRAPHPSPPTPHVPVEKVRDTLAAARAFSGG